MNKVKLYLGDCIEYMKLYRDMDVDAVITDPPYGTGKIETRGGSYKVLPKKKRFNWDKWDTKWMQYTQFKCAAIFVPPQELPKMLVNNRLLCAVTKQGVCVKNVSPIYRIQPIVLIGKTPINYMSDWAEYMNTGAHKFHPTEKDLSVMEWLIRLTTNVGDVVFDPFMGSGTTGVAAIKLGRYFIGCEIDPVYFEIAKTRINNAMEQSNFLYSDNNTKQSNFI